MPTFESRKNADGSISHRVKVRLKGLPSPTATFSRKTDAKAWAQSQEAALREGRYFKNAAAKKHTVAELIDRYTGDVLASRPRHALSQKAQLDWWKARLGQVLLSDLSPSKIVECRDKLRNGKTVRNKPRSPATVNRYLAALSVILSVAVREWQWLDSNPMLQVSKLKEPRGRDRFLSTEQRIALLESCSSSCNPFLYAIVILAISTGMRRGEMLSLRRHQIDLQRGRIVLHDTKNGDKRSVPLTGKALKLIAARVENIADSGALLFPNRYGAKPIEIKKAWTNALAKAGIENFRFHDLRHTAASYLLEANASLGQIAEILGHRTLQMVKRYAHLSESASSSIVGAMNQHIFGGINWIGASAPCPVQVTDQPDAACRQE